MSPEDRTRAALHEVADGLPVTDEELRRLEEHVMALLDTRPRERDEAARSRRGWELAVAAVAVLVLVLGGIAFWRNGRDSAAPLPAHPPTATGGAQVDPALVGLWRNELNGTWLWQITGDGRVGWDQSADGYLMAYTDLRTVRSRDGDTYDLGLPQSCVTRLRIELVDPDTARVTFVDDECGGDQSESEPLELDRVSGRDAASAPLVPGYAAGPSRRPVSIVGVSGTWLEPGSGTVLAIGTSVWGGGVSYLVDDDGDAVLAPDQRGTMALTSTGAIAPVPDPRTPNGCAPVFTAVTTDTATMTTTAGEGGCFPAGTTQTWIALN